MTKEHSPDRLDVKAFAQAGAHMSGHDTLLKYERLAQEGQGLHPDLRVDWSVDGEIRSTHGLASEIWLHLKADATLPLTCQRCLQPVDVLLQVDRAFRFVADEATAEALDDESEEDLLALSREFNLRELLEDELIMALPLVPRHEECPQAVRLASSDEDFEAANATAPNPFAALANLKIDKPQP